MIIRELVEMVDEVVLELSEPITNEDMVDGWTEKSRASVKDFFLNLKSKLEANDEVPPLNISRSLDHWGVVGGSILEKAAQISNALRAMRN